jgi:hypothetical protein
MCSGRRGILACGRFPESSELLDPEVDVIEG